MKHLTNVPVMTLVCALLVVSACTLTGIDNDLPMEVVMQWQEDIDQMVDLYDPLENIPEHLMQDDPVLQGDEFDVMTLFEILDHLGMADGYRLSYYYYYDGFGGFPVLYALAEDSPPYTNEKDYRAAHPECFPMKNLGNQCSYDYLQSIEIDGSELGYLQLIQVYMIGGQFYLYWHLNYYDSILVATEERLDQLIKERAETESGAPFNQKQVRQARALDPTPVVEIGNDSATIRVLWFTKWGGFYETWYKISTAFPHTITEKKKNQLLEYNCGINF